jgi:hypothetical protein
MKVNALMWRENSSGSQIPVGVFTNQAVIDFGSTGSDTAILNVTGQPNILATSFVDASILVKDSPNHSADEHWIESIEIKTGNIIAGTGFTIYARTLTNKLYGRYNVQWSWK